MATSVRTGTYRKRGSAVNTLGVAACGIFDWTSSCQHCKVRDGQRAKVGDIYDAMARYLPKILQILLGDACENPALLASEGQVLIQAQISLQSKARPPTTKGAMLSAVWLLLSCQADQCHIFPEDRGRDRYSVTSREVFSH